MKKFLIKFLLLFKPKKYRLTRDGFFTIVYKQLFGREYFLKKIRLPPEHPNCRCVIIN